MADQTCVHCTPGEWITRGNCGPWTPLLEQIYCGANQLITAAYVTIAAILVYASLLEKHDEFRPSDRLTVGERRATLLVYAAFILSCGIGHLEAPLAFRWAYYPAFAAWDCVTASVSWLAAVVTWKHRLRIVGGLI